MKIFSILSILLLLASTALASEDMQPATFEHEDLKRRLDNRIEFPEVKGDMSTMIYCFAQIEKSGKMKDTGCFLKDNFDPPFVNAITKAAKKSTMTPAIINGDKRKIYLQFRVEFIAKGDERDIYLYLNPANTENIEAYGYDHIAAQRALGKESWQGVCPQRARYLLIARAFVGEDGRAGHTSLEHVNGIRPTADCQNAIRETLLQSSFTPAIADGYPVPSAFVESFSN
jgi:hypothetical protein